MARGVAVYKTPNGMHNYLEHSIGLNAIKIKCNLQHSSSAKRDGNVPTLIF